MTYTRREFLTGTLAIATGCATTRQEQQQRKEVPAPTYNKNIGFVLLDIEREVGFPTPQKSYHKLEELLVESKQRIINKMGPIRVLQEIDAILNRSFTHATNADTSLLGAALSQGRCDIDCDITSYLYLAIGEELKLPLRGVVAPEHMFVRLNHQPNYINWETTTGKYQSDEEYIVCLNIPGASLAKGVYLHSLSREEIIGKHFGTIATELYLSSQLDKATPFFDKALQLFPTDVASIANKALILEEINHPKEAFELYFKALALDENSAIINSNIGLLLLKNGKIKEGRAFLKKARELAEKRP